MKDPTSLITDMLIFKKIGEKKGVDGKTAQRIGLISGYFDPKTAKTLLPFEQIKIEQETIKRKAAEQSLSAVSDVIRRLAAAIDDESDAVKERIKKSVPEIFPREDIPTHD